MNFKQSILQRQEKKYSENPFITSLYAADPAAHVWNDGKLYVYASRDIDKSNADLSMDNMDHYHVFSTADMVNWTDNGEIFSSDKAKWGIKGFMWAPDAAYKDERYYFYYPHPSAEPWNNTWKIGVAVSDYPASGFKDLGPIDGLGGHALIDPSVFVDDDGQAYMYYGGGAHAFQGKLNADMCSLASPMQEIQGLKDFHEATWVFKRNGIYYLTYSDNHRGANHMCYATSSLPLGTWQYQGVYMLPVGCETAHGSVVKFKDNWYAFYHNSAVSNLGALRSICCDRLEFNENGSIQTVVQTRSGMPPIAEHGFDKPDEISVYNIKENINIIEINLKNDDRSIFGNVASGFSHVGSSITFDNINGFESGRVALGIYYATEERLSKFRVIVNGKDWSLVNCPYTGSSHTFDGYSTITVIMKPGNTNTISLVGGSGELSLEGISVQTID